MPHSGQKWEPGCIAVPHSGQKDGALGAGPLSAGGSGAGDPELDASGAGFSEAGASAAGSAGATVCAGGTGAGPEGGSWVAGRLLSMPLMSVVLRVMMTLSITDSNATRSMSSVMRQRIAHIMSETRNAAIPLARLARTIARKKKAVKMAQKR